MTLSAADYVLEAEGFASRPSALLRSIQQKIGPHHATVKPVKLTAATNPADDADIWAVDFGGDIGDKKFRQSERIGRDWRLLLHSHCSKSPHRLPHEALGNLSTTVVCRTYFFHVAAKIQSCVASCLVPAQGTHDFVHSVSTADNLTLISNSDSSHPARLSPAGCAPAAVDAPAPQPRAAAGADIQRSTA